MKFLQFHSLASGSFLLCRKQTGGTSQERHALQRSAEMENTSEIIVGPVQLVNWEDQIFWGESEAAALQPIPEEEDMLLDDRGEPSAL